MSHKATNWAVSQRGISPVAKVLLWQLADRHNPDNGCFPDQDTLARDCEISRATVNRNLLDLERLGLIKRVVRHHPVNKKRMPTRYVLAFEDEFAEIVSSADEAEDSTESEESHVSNCDMAFEASHVSNSGQAMSHLEAKPCLTGETHNRLTSKLTSKVTKTRDERAERESDFKKIWKLFPTRPGSPEMAAWEAFSRLDDADAAKAVIGVERYAAHFREQGAISKDSPEDRLRYVPYLANWLAKQDWIAAASLPLKTVPGTDAAKALEAVAYVHKFGQPQLFAACERLYGRSVPVGSSGRWGFPKDLVNAARSGLGKGAGPP